MSLPYNKKLISGAKELRKNMTQEEKRLWYDFLSKYPIRFQRQKVIDNYIVDFYCHQANLVVELDGSQHFSPEAVAYDDRRTKALENRGLRVMRFTNNDIHHHFEGVCQSIERYIRTPPVSEARLGE